MSQVGPLPYGKQMSPAPLPFPDRTAYLEHLRRDAARFREVLAAADPGTSVPTCPGWSAADLTWHLTEVHAFWAGLVEGQVVDDAAVDAVEEAKPPRPAGSEALLALSEEMSARLIAALRSTPASTPMWSWFAADRTVGFAYRRQAHEALIHRVDAELTTGVPVAPIDPLLAADGVDEVLRVMWGLPDGDWFSWHPGRYAVRLRATDTGHSWLVRLGRFTGTGPQSGTEFDEPTAVVMDQDPAGGAGSDLEVHAEVSATAADLDQWLWGRAGDRLDAVRREGDATALDLIDELIATGIG